MAGKALEGKNEENGAVELARTQAFDGEDSAVFREDGRVERILKATLRHIEFGSLCGDSPTSADA
jgi:hypothetical protein